MTTSAWHYRYAARVLTKGGIIAYPTEAVFGLGCDPDNVDAVYCLLELKQRPVHKGLILIASDFSQVEKYLQPLSTEVAQRVQLSWPGPVTWVLPAKRSTPPWLTGWHDSLAVRVTNHPIARRLCNCYGGALVSTSANPAGLHPAKNELTVRRYFGNDIDFILYGEVGEDRKPSEIRDGLSDRVLRSA